MDLRRRRRGRRSCAAPHHLSSAARRLALVLLGLRGHRAGGGPGLVSGGAGPPRATFLDDSAGGRTHPIRFAAPADWTQRAQGRPVEDDSGEQRGAVGFVELFLFFLFRQHFLHLVLPLPEDGAPPGPQVERLFRDASVSGDGHLLTPGWLDQRHPDEALRETHGPLRDSGGLYRTLGAVHRAGDAGAGRAAGQHRARGGRRRLVSFPEFLLVGDGRHRRPFRRNRFRRNEYARAIWRRRGPFSHSVDGRALWLAGGVPGGRGPGRDGISRLAGGKSRADTASGAVRTRGKDLKHESKILSRRPPCTRPRRLGDGTTFRRSSHRGLSQRGSGLRGGCHGAIVRAALVYVARHAAAVQDQVRGPRRDRPHEEGGAQGGFGGFPGNAGRHRRRSGGIGVRHGGRGRAGLRSGWRPDGHRHEVPRPGRSRGGCLHPRHAANRQAAIPDFQPRGGPFHHRQSLPFRRRQYSSDLRRRAGECGRHHHRRRRWRVRGAARARRRGPQESSGPGQHRAQHDPAH